MSLRSLYSWQCITVQISLYLFYLIFTFPVLTVHNTLYRFANKIKDN